MERIIRRICSIFWRSGDSPPWQQKILSSIIAAKNNNWYKASIQKPEFVKEFSKKYISVERIGNGEDLTNFISLIISEKNKFMNGSIVRVDGGIK